jgi:hypothetical protein
MRQPKKDRMMLIIMSMIQQRGGLEIRPLKIEVMGCRHD